jgi:hypothetical protein
LRQLKSTGELDFPKLTADPDDTWLRLISRGLNLDTTQRVTISGPKAEAWRQALIGQGVRARGWKPAAPTALACALICCDKLHRTCTRACSPTL